MEKIGHRRAAAADQQVANRDRWTGIDALLQDVVDRRLLSGGVAAAWQADRVAHHSSAGFRSVALGEPMRVDSLFRIYSMTKPVTAVAMMILWDDGLWRPNDPIADRLPELAGLQVIETSGSEIRTVPLTKQPTLEHLMTHQAGFTYGFTDDPVDHLFRAAKVPPIPHDIAADEYLARVARVPLAFQPGTNWRYGVSMDLQGIIVERLSGMTLRDFMRARIFEPLGMVDTDFIVPDAKRDRLAAIYSLAGDELVEVSRDSDGIEYSNVSGVSPTDLLPPYDKPPLTASGGGGLVSTAADYLRFGRMLLGEGTLGGVRIMSPEAAALMMRSHTPAHLLNGAVGTAPHWLRPGYEYAYNGVVITDPDAAGVELGRKTYLWDGAAGCWFWVDPANEVVFVCMVQLLADADRLGLQFRSRGVVDGILSAARL